jgi:hypothetical protein
MKRFAQFVCLLAIAILGIQPVFAGIACTLAGADTCVPDCPMAMGAMAADCPMAGQMAMSDCPPDCCTHTISQAIASPAAPEKFRLVISAVLMALPGTSIAERASAPSFAPIESRSGSPPLYLLNQIFRI